MRMILELLMLAFCLVAGVLRFCSGRVYQEARMIGSHPREERVYGFDIVTPSSVE